MRFYLKRLIILLAVAALAVGGYFFEERRKALQLDEMSEFAELVAKLGVVDALIYPPGPTKDSARAVLFREFDITETDVQEYLESFNGKEERLALFWSMTQKLTDSLIEIEMAKLRENDLSGAAIEQDSTAELIQP